MNHRPIRRRDRAVDDDAWIAAFLKRAPVGTLSTLHEGRPHANVNLFVFDEAENALYLHTAREGATRASIESDPRVCFSAHEMGRLLPAEMAVNFSVEFAGVVAFGRAEVVRDARSARRALELLMAKYAPHLELGRDYGGVRDRDLARTTVLRVAIESWSGKKKEVAPDFPGAYAYRET